MTAHTETMARIREGSRVEVIAFDIGQDADITLSRERVVNLQEQERIAYVLRWSQGGGKVHKRIILSEGESLDLYRRKRKALKIDTFQESI